MSLFTERNGMRKPIEKTSKISVDAYALLFDICSNHLQYLAWKYPDECPDGNGCCGIDLEKFDIDMKYTIPTLFRCQGQIDRPHIIKSLFDSEPHVDEYDQYALLDLIDFIAQNMRDISRKTYHSYYRHYDISFASTNAITTSFVKEINDAFDKTGLLYHLTDNLEVERIEEAGVLSESIEKNIQAIKEPGIKDLLTIAIQKHRSPDPNDQKDAVEKLWDAFERLKTYYTTLKKTDSANKIIGNMANSQPDYITLFTEEFRKLTDIGNDFRIRHHETNRIDITDIRYYDYFFNRCLSLIAMAIQYLQ